VWCVCVVCTQCLSGVCVCVVYVCVLCGMVCVCGQDEVRQDY